MTSPEPPDWYQIPREETGINARPPGDMSGTGQPPFNDLFTEQIGKVLAEIRQFFADWPAQIKAMIDTGIDWLQTVVGLELEWLRTLSHNVVDTVAAVFDVSSWVAFLDTAITSAANLVNQAFDTVFDWISSLLLGAVSFVESSCNLDLTWLRNLIGTATSWSKTNVDLTSQADFVDGVTNGGTTTNSLMGILFGPLFRIMHAGEVFGDTTWHAITTFTGSPSPAAWTAMVNAITASWNTFVDAVLSAWGSSKTHVDFPNPAEATEKALQNNPVTGWLFGGSGFGTALKKFSDALWDYLLGGNRYDGVTRTAWSKPAGAQLETAWRALWAQITGQPATSAPTPGTAGAQGLWNGISSNFIQSALTGIWEPLGNLGSLLIRAKNLVNALWDYAFGGSLYNGVAVTALSPTAGQNVSDAFNELMAQFGSDATAKTKGQIGSAVASSVLSGLFPTTSKFEDSFAWLGDMFQSGSKPSDPPADVLGTALNNAWEWFSGLMGWQTATETNQQNAQNFQISALTGSARNPTWVCRYPVGDVSYPESQNAFLNVYDSLGRQAPRAEYAANVGSEIPWQSMPGLWVIAAGIARGSYIGISNTAIMDTVGVLINRGTGTINNVFLEVFRENPDTSLTRIYNFDISSSLSTAGIFYVERTLSPGLVAQAGERYLVRVRNASTGTAQVSIQGLNPTSAMVQYGHRTNSSGDTNKTSYSSTEAAAVNVGAIAWTLLASQGQVATDQLYADDFNRSGMGALWFLQSTTSDQMGIAFGQASYAGLLDGSQHALYTRPLASDRMRVEGNLYNIISGTQEGLLLNCNRDLSQIVYLAVNNANARIYTGSATSLTQRASVSTTLNSVPWQFYYDPTTNTYTALKNGKSVGLSWADSSNLMQHGSLYRYGGLRISRGSLVNGGSIDNWLLKDWI
ncbi:hypothetical protein [[Mycobacterium] crassicus]|uniref:Minor tail protein n=1 Tax=[Mycobacterium] crassicus TaxID=2872309 RepID=A0ABU5XHF7_9MYCO|nr:hypothetical protein [Mycolicibacter sp. MYC098]MEB3021318.1 hypothetical protein [Mycolicibacter sp. MYC098]